MSGNSQLIQFLVGPGVDPAQASEYVESLKHASLESVEMLLRTFMQNIDVFADNSKLIDELFQLLQSNLLRQSREDARRLDADLIVALYDNLVGHGCARFLLLHCLAIARAPEHLRLLCDAIVQDPPSSWVQSGLVLSPLFQHKDWDVDEMFPQALDALQHPAVAGIVLDLANHLFRSGRLETHCAASRSDELISLLSALVSKLETAERDPSSTGETPQEVNRVVGESVALIVSLCDALALIGDQRARPVLQAAMDLSHRRIQTEAAGGLARFGDDDGTERLIALAAEPSARLRVLAYANELDLADRIDERFKSPASLAESELALWLAQPSQMSVPPGRIELIDERNQFWPGFESPVDCFLLRFEYTLGDQRYCGLGIVGPMVHALEADITTLSTDDAYAAFAGWQAEHDDIYEVAKAHWNEAQRRMASELTSGLQSQGFSEVTPEFLGFFLGEVAVVAVATHEGTTGISVTDGLETLWYPTQQRLRPMSPGDVWNIYKGRKMLRTFNP